MGKSKSVCILYGQKQIVHVLGRLKQSSAGPGWTGFYLSWKKFACVEWIKAGRWTQQVYTCLR